MMRTYAVKCAECQQHRYPTMEERPIRYVCARCLSTPKETRTKRKGSAAEGVKTRRANQENLGA